MTPVHCRTKHSPDDGTYGDCLRACIASLLDMIPEDVPHFAHDGAVADVVTDRLREWLAQRGLGPWWSHFDADEPMDVVLDTMGANNPGVHYLLFGCTASGEPHVVICKDDAVVWNPSWYGGALVRAGVHGAWSVMVLARV